MNKRQAKGFVKRLDSIIEELSNMDFQQANVSLELIEAIGALSLLRDATKENLKV